ncbi:MAG: AzlC family ABC transporter permease [Lachnospiraceae bacterium]|nr:AzlC family ABC transporter permease [Lachnospiraceae bacterium]
MTQDTIQTKNNLTAFMQGLKDGIPIGLGYLAVSFSLGIAAKTAGLTPMQGFVVSLLCMASAGEYVGFLSIAASAAYMEIAIATLIANARYLLMSTALSQRMESKLSIKHRLLMAFGITDELFGIAIARPGHLNPYYSYGAFITSAFPWALGTSLGIIAGNMLPARLVSAFSVALYGMFLAVIIPPAKKDKIIAGLIIVCFGASYTATLIPWLKDRTDGTRTIILTIVIASLAAILFPREVANDNTQENTP